MPATRTLLLLVVSGPCVMAQTLHVSPARALIDAPVRIWAEGFAPRATVIFRSARIDSDGHVWQAYAGLRADAHGVADLSKQAPVNGTYAGVQPMGLLTSMDLGGEPHARSRFAFKWNDTIRTSISVETQERVVATDTLHQVFADSGVGVKPVRQDGLLATLFTPARSQSAIGILVLGGSEGGLSSEDVAAQLASHGFTALALAYFGADSLPKALDRISLEYFARALRYLRGEPGVRGLAIFGTSKGAEAALVVASRDTSIRAVVGYAPSSVVWSCICAAVHASWAMAGEDLANVPAGGDPTYRPPQGFPIQPAINYRFRMRDTAVRARAMIPVERIRGPILLVAGIDDALWPSLDMSREVASRRRRAHATGDVYLEYPNAGHLIGKAYLPVGTTLIGGGRLETGGTVGGNAAAQADAWPKVLQFLKRLPPAAVR